MNLATFTAGQIIFTDGSPSGCAFLIESGSVEISLERHGVKEVINVLGPKNIFGEVALIDSSPRTATAIAVTDTVLLQITREQLHDRLAKADPILSMLVNTLLSRYRAAINRSKGLSAPAPTDQSPPPASPQSAAEEHRDAFAKIRLESELRAALEEGALDVFYQPLLNVQQGYWAGFEALVRWRHPARGVISPAEFIAIAEETSLIEPLGLYVLTQALRDLLEFQQLRDTHSPGRPPLFMGINISGRQFEDPELFTKIHHIVAETGVNPHCVKLEITESLIIDYVTVSEWVKRCKETGFSIALDDFGTGYSTFEQLMALEFDTMKIDQTFIKRFFDSDRAMSMVKGMIGLGKGLNMAIVAEGIETQEHLDALIQLGCDLGQGYHIAKPLVAETVREQIKHQSA